ncbi:MAG TPA: hypothetical protein VNJ03_09570 [Vicinamibacterales bacterium]|nr:hypothetical protein [Vicinamibacterales bacterium]
MEARRGPLANVVEDVIAGGARLSPTLTVPANRTGEPPTKAVVILEAVAGTKTEAVDAMTGGTSVTALGVMVGVLRTAVDAIAGRLRG